MVFALNQQSGQPRPSSFTCITQNQRGDRIKAKQKRKKRMYVASTFHKLQAILICISFHEPHESVPLSGRPHYILCFNP